VQLLHAKPHFTLTFSRLSLLLRRPLHGGTKLSKQKTSFDTNRRKKEVIKAALCAETTVFWDSNKFGPCVGGSESAASYCVCRFFDTQWNICRRCWGIGSYVRSPGEVSRNEFGWDIV
jgi:hypothetical protein